ncbi:DinB family protein [Lysinibacillus sp. NPDC047702]|uniref:DinB family protein n=1 Tax=unclassified Lysinibacillus TaxID=2636778 RepID=UPI003D091E0F
MNQFITDQLRETRNNLVAEIELLNNTQLNGKHEANSWSIAQVCHHLVLVEESSIKAIAWGLKQTDLKKTNRKNVQLIVDRSNKITAPKIVEPTEDIFTVQQIIELLSESRKKFITFLDTIEDKSILPEKSVKHPALGELPLDQWIEHIYLHEQRHIEQIKEIKGTLESTSNTL